MDDFFTEGLCFDTSKEGEGGALGWRSPIVRRAKRRPRSRGYERRARPVVRRARSMGRGRAHPRAYCTSHPRSAHLPLPHTTPCLAERIASPAPKVIGLDSPKDTPGLSLFSRPVFGISIFGYYVLPLFDRDDGRRGFLILLCSENYRDVLTRLSTALAMTEAAYLEARRRRDL
jgi:hypothetical protein